MYSKNKELVLYPEKYRFYNFTHFKIMIKKLCRKRDWAMNYSILNEQRVSLYYMVGNWKFFIRTPCRGKYCRHLEFFDLQRVYLDITTNKSEGI